MNDEPIRVTPEAASQLLLDPEPWMSCDDCFDELDGYVEALLSGTGGDRAPLRAHLHGCSACLEEAQGLVTLVASHDLVSSEQALFYLACDLDSASGNS